MINLKQKTSSELRWIALIWSAFALANATEPVILIRAEGMQRPQLRVFLIVFLGWLAWAASTPFVIWLGRRFPLVRARPFSSWSIHLAACAVINLACAGWNTWLRIVLPLSPGGVSHVSFVGATFSTFFSDFYLSVLLYAAVLAITYTLDSRRKLAFQAMEEARLNEQLSKAQLDALRRQLEPHFMFNTLNAVAGLVRDKRNDAAVEIIAKLSDLLRRVLDDSDQQRVALGEEMEFLEKYLEIQKVRFAERLKVTLDVPKELLAAQLPGLILQPIVENAIEHGIATRTEGGIIRIAASRADSVLIISICNDGPELPVDREQLHQGIGISNVWARLKNLYGDACALRIDNRAAGGVEVSISVPYSSVAHES